MSENCCPAWQLAAARCVQRCLGNACIQPMRFWTLASQADAGSLTPQGTCAAGGSAVTQTLPAAVKTGHWSTGVSNARAGCHDSHATRDMTGDSSWGKAATRAAASRPYLNHGLQHRPPAYACAAGQPKGALQQDQRHAQQHLCRQVVSQARHLCMSGVLNTHRARTAKPAQRRLLCMSGQASDCQMGHSAHQQTWHRAPGMAPGRTAAVALHGSSIC